MHQPTTITAIFSHVDAVLAAVKALKQARLEPVTVYSPAPHHELSRALQLKPSRVRLFTLLGGIAGGISGFSLAVYAAVQWHLISGGRPVVAWIPFVVVAFEFTILLGVLCTVTGMLLAARLPRLAIPDHYDRRFTLDKFGVVIRCDSERRDEAAGLLMGAGAEELHEQR